MCVHEKTGREREYLYVAKRGCFTGLVILIKRDFWQLHISTVHSSEIIFRLECLMIKSRQLGQLVLYLYM